MSTRTAAMGYNVSETVQVGSVAYDLDEANYEYYDIIAPSPNQNPIAWSWNSMALSLFVVCELITSILGILGNLLVVVVVFQRRSRSRSTDILVGNLAIADFLTCVFLLPYPEIRTVPDSWLGSLYCRFVRGHYLMWTSVTASIYSLLAVTVDRYFAMVYPIHFKRYVTRPLINVVVVSVWTVSSMLMVPMLVINKMNIDGVCVFIFPSTTFQAAFGVYIFAIRIAVPTTIMLFTQLAIVRTLHRQSSRFENTTASFHDVARTRILKLTFTIVLLYIVCWSPNQFAFLAYNLGLTQASYAYSPLSRVFIVIAFCNSCVNPILYTLRHPQFRDAVRAYFKRSTGSHAPIFAEPSLASKQTPNRKKSSA
ncbi:neuropeptide Y receptor type 6-like [Diadema antillarum]|uniref:neuropeptide Y receptor type 6-like n=1 Tax=Diadema antillarum TaxID=105358 RepID=UPI003A899C40